MPHVSCFSLSQPNENKDEREGSRVGIDINNRTEAGFRSFPCVFFVCLFVFFNFLETFVTTVGGTWRACEYLVTTTGLSMHYYIKPKDFLCVSLGRRGSLIRCNGGFSLRTSWVSHFSGCHNSSRNI